MHVAYIVLHVVLSQIMHNHAYYIDHYVNAFDEYRSNRPAGRRGVYCEPKLPKYTTS